MKKKLLLILSILLIPATLAAVYYFKILDTTAGLTSSQVNSIIKDMRGYIWIGTPSGLYRYDGYIFKNFQSNSQDGSSLPDSYIEQVQEAIDGSLWVTTASGMCIYHPQTETFERDMKQYYAKIGINEEPQLVFIDKNRNLWMVIAGKGVKAYNMQQQLLYEFGYTDDEMGIPQGKICSIGECRDGVILVYDNALIVCCDIMKQQRRVWKTDALAKQSIRRSSSLKVFADQMDNIWLYGQGTLMMYDKKTDHWDTTVGNEFGLTGTKADCSVYGMDGDRNGNIWIATDRMGLLRMDVNTHATEKVQPQGMNSFIRSDESMSIQSVYVDNTDLLWVGTERNGLAYYGRNIYRFQGEQIGDITAICETDSNKILYGTSDKGVIGLDAPLSGKNISAMLTTNDGSLWVGTKRNGLTRIKGGHVTFYTNNDSTKTLISNRVNALCKDKMGNLWIATPAGLQVFNPRMNTFSSYTKENGRLYTNNITALHYTKNNMLLVGTGEGLMIMNLSTTEKTMLTGNATNMKSFTNNFITQVFEDSRGLIWLGTREGLNVLNMSNDSLHYIKENDGLCNNNICGITEDLRHNIWVSTSNGISRIVVQRNPDAGSFVYGLYNYNTADGLLGNEFNPGAILIKKSGGVTFGGLYGVNSLRRLNKEERESLPRVMLTQLFIDGKEIAIGHEYDGRITLQQALNESKRIVLTNNQNTFSIKFAAGNYNQSERLQFMYWMEGLDDDWKSGDALGHGVNFTDLSSGDYTLHVKAVNSEGEVSRQERTLEIIVLPPWWISWWMLLVYLVVAIIIGFGYRWVLRRYQYIWQKKKAVVNELICQREEIKAASDELRQPMARMASIIGTLSETDHSIEEKEQLNALHFQMLQIITRISEMQTTLENPEDKAATTAANRLQLNDSGVVSITQMTDGELTSDLRNIHRNDLPTQNYIIAIVDDNERFLKYISSQLGNIYTIHTYKEVRAMINDLNVLKADIIVCKQDMPFMTGSDLCSKVKSDSTLHNTKFVLMTDGVLTPHDMQGMNITLAADEYLAKPFNLKDAAMRFNKLLGLQAQEGISNLIEGSETRVLEGRNASMTTATISYDHTGVNSQKDEITPVSTIEELMVEGRNATDTTENVSQEFMQMYGEDETLGDYSMNDEMDRQLMINIEQYVLHNMSRGQISMEDMANSMGMGRVPFFHKIKSITTKTPAELVREIRLRHACTLLIKTDINMSELAINIGFQTAENFIRHFKEKYGVSPLEYRLNHRKE